ncbi:TorF family putative porin [Polymorphobacter sp.]|uniref:TorF family putative porin n=1 Tax=Polymorphobacter sp. TaxID=1909290 RepID=UPI003F722245
MRILSPLLLAAAAAIATPVAAAPLVNADARIVSDYRFRGVSRSNVRPAAQASIDLDAAGFHAGVFASTVRSPAGADAELTLTAGYAQPLGLGTLDLGVAVYTFPGSDKPSTIFETQAMLSGAIGPLSLTAGAAWAPRQSGLATQTRRMSNLHVWSAARADIIGTPLSLNARLGHSRGSPGLTGGEALVAPARAWDWRVGADYSLGLFTLGAAVTGTDLGRQRAEAIGLATPNGRNRAGTGVLVSLSAGF